MSMERPETAQPESPATVPPQSNTFLYAVIAAGIAVVVAFAAWSMQSGGLPGTQNSPSATVKGEPMAGRTGN